MKFDWVIGSFVVITVVVGGWTAWSLKAAFALPDSPPPRADEAPAKPQARPAQRAPKPERAMSEQSAFRALTVQHKDEILGCLSMDERGYEAPLATVTLTPRGEGSGFVSALTLVPPEGTECVQKVLLEQPLTVPLTGAVTFDTFLDLGMGP